MDRQTESGNVLIIILTAIVLIGLLTAVIQGTSTNDGANIDKEQLVLNASRVRQYAMELENAVSYIMRNGHSEVDIRFANPDTTNTDYGDITDDVTRQVFHVSGGAAEYRSAPAGIQGTSAPWEFYGGSALPDVGTTKPDLIAVLPDVTLAFCQKINEINGYAAGVAPPVDTGTCLHEGDTKRFDDGVQFSDGAPNTVYADPNFVKPALQGCAQCQTGGKYQFFHVLLKR